MYIKMIGISFLAVFFYPLSPGKCFILVPSELPLALQLFYTKIPPIRTGTDSKVGFGFRIGRNADFQVLFELGPQENTIDNTRGKKSTT